MWFGAHLPGLPWGKAALIRILGSLLVAAACFAVAMARVDDPVARGRGLAWFAAAHFVVFLTMALQRRAILGAWLSQWVVLFPMTAANIFFYAWWQARLDERGMPGARLPLFGNSASSSTQQLRSAYEQQIREAAGQEERHRLARDLHDAIKQEIFVVQTAAATVEARFDNDPEGARSALEQVRAAAREAMAEMEAMLDQLRAAPLETTGLVEALRKQCEALGFRTGARVEFQLGTLPPNEELAPGAQQAIFRAAQEALANAGRHARAANVEVSLDAVGPKLELTVRDDGSGFDTNQRASGMGIRNMRERAARIRGRIRNCQHAGWRHHGPFLGSCRECRIRGLPETDLVQRRAHGYLRRARHLAPGPRAAAGGRDVHSVVGPGRERLPPHTRAPGDLSMSKTTIAIVDDHRVVARSLKAYLESFEDLEVIGIAASGEELLEHLREWHPQIVLQDLLLAGGIDGVETTRRITAASPTVRVIALTASTDEARMMGVLRAGAVGYVRKDAEPEVLLAAVRAVARGKTYIDPTIARAVSTPPIRTRS